MNHPEEGRENEHTTPMCLRQELVRARDPRQGVRLNVKEPHILIQHQWVNFQPINMPNIYILT